MPHFPVFAINCVRHARQKTCAHGVIPNCCSCRSSSKQMLHARADLSEPSETRLSVCCRNAFCWRAVRKPLRARSTASPHDFKAFSSSACVGGDGAFGGALAASTGSSFSGSGKARLSTRFQVSLPRSPRASCWRSCPGAAACTRETSWKLSWRKASCDDARSLSRCSTAAWQVRVGPSRALSPSKAPSTLRNSSLALDTASSLMSSTRPHSSPTLADLSCSALKCEQRTSKRWFRVASTSFPDAPVSTPHDAAR
mmetsp:Transcript_64467/g.192052  ORF Transcript_64467/g.192052 Transcript_64467/m.192052 type:complete len:255 (-) Transcript_64467:251-1015(-)